MGTWAKNKTLKEIVAILQLQALESIEPLTLALFTRVLNWTEVETQVLMAMVRNEVKDRLKRLYLLCNIIYGRNPGNEPTHFQLDAALGGIRGKNQKFCHASSSSTEFCTYHSVFNIIKRVLGPDRISFKIIQ